MKLLIGADIVPTENNMEFFINGNDINLVGEEIKKELSSADFIVLNLETPLTNIHNPIEKWGPALSAPIDTIEGIKAINPFFYTLANNHILDQGVEGLKSTIHCLEKNHIDYCGVGNSIHEMKHSYIKEIDGINIGIYCCAEHEFSIATNNSAGANPYDPLTSFEHVKELKQSCDYVFVLYHGGKEHYRYPSPNLQRIFRKFADVGADIVIAQHTHCVGCKEEYNGKTLVYGQGNFLFHGNRDEYWNTGLLISVEISVNRNVKIRYIPLCMTNTGIEKSKNEQIIQDFLERSDLIKKEGFIEEQYRQFGEEKKEEYLSAFYGKKYILQKVLNKVMGYKLFSMIYSKKYDRKQLLILRNFIECEAHRELLLRSISNHKKNN